MGTSLKKGGVSVESLILEITADISQAVGAIKSIVNQVKNMGSIIFSTISKITSTFINWGNEVAEVADIIDKASQKLGISAKAYQELEFILADNGVNISVLKKMTYELAQEMERASTGSSELFKKLGISAKDATGELKSMDDILYESIFSLASIEDINKRNALATELLGKKAQELAPLLNSGVDSIKELRGLANSLGLVLPDELIKDAVRMGDLMGRFNRSITNIGLQLKAFIIPILNTLLDNIIAILPTIIAYTQRIISYVQLIGANISNVVGKLFGLLGVNIAPQGAQQATESMDAYSTSIEEVGEATKKASKQIASFDEVITLAGGDAGTQDMPSMSGGELTDYIKGASNIASITEALDKLEAKILDILSKIGEQVKKFTSQFKEGFNEAFKPSSINFNGLIEAFKGIKLKPELDNLLGNLLESIPLNLGKVVGSLASIGATMGANLVGGLTIFLEDNIDYVQERLKGIFTSALDLSNIVGGLSITLADIFSVFGSEDAQLITASIIGIINNSLLGCLDLGARFGVDFIKSIADIITSNKDAIKEALDGIITIIAGVLALGNLIVKQTFTDIIASYTQYISPMFKAIADGLSFVVGICLNSINTYIIPAVNNLVSVLIDFYNTHLKEIIAKAIIIITQLGETFGYVFKLVVAPLVGWLISDVLRQLGVALKGIGDVLGWLLKWAGDVFNGMGTSLVGFMDIVNGVLTGDLDRILKGMLNMARGNLESLVGIFKQPLNLIVDMVNALIRGINSISIKVPDWLKSMPGMGNVGDFKMNISTLPKLAKGGITNGATLAMIGDNIGGKEAVLPLSSNTEWMHTLANIINQGARTAPVNVSLNSTLGVYDEYTLQQVGRVLAPYLV